MKGKILLGILLVFFVGGCNNSAEFESIECNVESAVTITKSLDMDLLAEDVDLMLSLGIDTTKMLIRDTYYIAGGIYVPKDRCFEGAIYITRKD